MFPNDSPILPHREIAGGVDFIPLIKPNDAAECAREIRKLSDMSPLERALERAMMGQQASRLLEERFSLPAMHAAYAEGYAQVTGYQTPSLVET